MEEDATSGTDWAAARGNETLNPSSRSKTQAFEITADVCVNSLFDFEDAGPSET